MRTHTRMLAIGLILGFAGICSTARAIDTAALKNTLEGLWRDKLKGKVSEKAGALTNITDFISKGISASLVNFDPNNRTISFSPMFLQLAAQTAQQYLTGFKKFSLEPHDDRLSFNIEFAEGSKVAMDFVPQHIELDVNEFSIVGLIPGGIKLEQAEKAATGLAGYLDAFLGVSEKVGKLMKNVTFEGDTVRLSRPYQASVFGRAMRPDEGSTASASTMPFKMENGWLKMSLQNSESKIDLWQMTLKMLADRLQKPSSHTDK